jgi:acetolactate decarboxylase
MIRKSWLAGWLAVCAVVAGCAGPAQHTVFQTSTIDALLAGVYDGDLTLRELRRHGDFGIGTYDNLDGEMVLLEGEFHQMKADGRVYSPDLDGETPFAAVCRFRGGRPLAMPGGLDMAAVEAWIDQQAPNPNLFYAIRIDGAFQDDAHAQRARAGAALPPLKDVAATQPVFDMREHPGHHRGLPLPAVRGGRERAGVPPAFHQPGPFARRAHPGVRDWTGHGAGG